MEMNRFLLFFILALAIASCSNSPELETGEIKTLNIIKQSFQKSKKSNQFVDARILLSREQIDAAGTPVLFIELESGQNGTLTPYPGQGDGQTWLGADGATVTLQRGVLKASRGMGNDLMGSFSSMPPWEKIRNNLYTYNRKLSYISGNNKISELVFECDIQKSKFKETIKIWDLEVLVVRYEENCYAKHFDIRNTYFLDANNTVRKSSQYHGETVGYLIMERIER